MSTGSTFGGRQCPLVVWWLHFMASVSVPCGLIMKHHQLRGFKQQELILSHLWRPEDLSQGVVRALVPPKAVVKNPFCSLPASGSWQRSLEFLGLWPDLSHSCPHPHMAFFPTYLCVSCPLLLRTPLIGFRTCPNPV